MISVGKIMLIKFSFTQIVLTHVVWSIIYEYFHIKFWLSTEWIMVKIRWNVKFHLLYHTTNYCLLTIQFTLTVKYVNIISSAIFSLDQCNFLDAICHQILIKCQLWSQKDLLAATYPLIFNEKDWANATIYFQVSLTGLDRFYHPNMLNVTTRVTCYVKYFTKLIDVIILGR